MKVRVPSVCAIVFGVATLLSVSNAAGSLMTEDHLGGVAPAGLIESGVNATRDCSSLGPDPGAESSGPISYNASAFWGELCVNETFGEILTAWGGWEWSYWILPNGQSGNYWAAQNLSTSLVPQPNSSSLHVVYLLNWVAPCDNSTLGPAGTSLHCVGPMDRQHDHARTEWSSFKRDSHMLVELRWDWNVRDFP